MIVFDRVASRRSPLPLIALLTALGLLFVARASLQLPAHARADAHAHATAAATAAVAAAAPDRLTEIRETLRRGFELNETRGEQARFLKQALWPRMRPKHFLVGCAKAAPRELPYIVEWLEYHRLIGFDKMIIYIDDLPTEQELGRVRAMRLLQAYYREVLREPNFLEMRSAASVLFDATADSLSPKRNPYTLSNTHRLSQQSIALHCYRAVAQQTEWFAHFDIDEFWVPGGAHNASLSDWLHALYSERGSAVADLYTTDRLAGIYATSLNFGLTSGKNVFSPQVDLQRTPLAGQLNFIASEDQREWAGANNDTDPESAIADAEGTSDLLQLQDMLVTHDGTAVELFTQLLSQSVTVPQKQLPMILQKLTKSAPPKNSDLKTMLSITGHLRPSCNLTAA